MLAVLLGLLWVGGAGAAIVLGDKSGFVDYRVGNQAKEWHIDCNGFTEVVLSRLEAGELKVGTASLTWSSGVLELVNDHGNGNSSDEMKLVLPVFLGPVTVAYTGDSESGGFFLDYTCGRQECKNGGDLGTGSGELAYGGASGACYLIRCDGFVNVRWRVLELMAGYTLQVHSSDASEDLTGVVPPGVSSYRGDTALVLVASSDDEAGLNVVGGPTQDMYRGFDLQWECEEVAAKGVIDYPPNAATYPTFDKQSWDIECDGNLTLEWVFLDLAPYAELTVSSESGNWSTRTFGYSQYFYVYTYMRDRFPTQLEGGVTITFTSQHYFRGLGFVVSYECGSRELYHYYDASGMSGKVDYPLGSSELGRYEDDKLFRVKCADHVNVQWDVCSPGSGRGLVITDGNGHEVVQSTEGVPRERSFEGEMVLRFRTTGRGTGGGGIQLEWWCGPKEVTDDEDTCYGAVREVTAPSGKLGYPEGAYLQYNNPRCWRVVCGEGKYVSVNEAEYLRVFRIWFEESSTGALVGVGFLKSQYLGWWALNMEYECMPLPQVTGETSEGSGRFDHPVGEEAYTGGEGVSFKVLCNGYVTIDWRLMELYPGDALYVFHGAHEVEKYSGTVAPGDTGRTHYKNNTLFVLETSSVSGGVPGIYRGIDFVWKCTEYALSGKLSYPGNGLERYPLGDEQSWDIECDGNLTLKWDYLDLAPYAELSVRDVESGTEWVMRSVVGMGYRVTTFMRNRFPTEFNGSIAISFTSGGHSQGRGFILQHNCAEEREVELWPKYFYDASEPSGEVDYPLGVAHVNLVEDKLFRIQCADYVNVRWLTLSLYSGSLEVSTDGGMGPSHVFSNGIPQQRSFKGDVVMHLSAGDGGYFWGYGVGFTWTCGTEEVPTDDEDTCYGVQEVLTGTSGTVRLPSNMPYWGALLCWRLTCDEGLPEFDRPNRWSYSKVTTRADVEAHTVTSVLLLRAYVHQFSYSCKPNEFIEDPPAAQGRLDYPKGEGPYENGVHMTYAIRCDGFLTMNWHLLELYPRDALQVLSRDAHEVLSGVHAPRGIPVYEGGVLLVLESDWVEETAGEEYPMLHRGLDFAWECVAENTSGVIDYPAGDATYPMSDMQSWDIECDGNLTLEWVFLDLATFTSIKVEEEETGKTWYSVSDWSVGWYWNIDNRYLGAFPTSFTGDITIELRAYGYEYHRGFVVRHTCGGAEEVSPCYAEVGGEVGTKGHLSYPVGGEPMAEAEDKLFVIKCEGYVNVRWDHLSLGPSKELRVTDGQGDKLLWNSAPVSWEGDVTLHLKTTSYGHAQVAYGFAFDWECAAEADGDVAGEETCFGAVDVLMGSGTIVHPLPGTPPVDELRCWEIRCGEEEYVAADWALLKERDGVVWRSWAHGVGAEEATGGAFVKAARSGRSERISLAYECRPLKVEEQGPGSGRIDHPSGEAVYERGSLAGDAFLLQCDGFVNVRWRVLELRPGDTLLALSADDGVQLFTNTTAPSMETFKGDTLLLLQSAAGLTSDKDAPYRGIDLNWECSEHAMSGVIDYPEGSGYYPGMASERWDIKCNESLTMEWTYLNLGPYADIVLQCDNGMTWSARGALGLPETVFISDSEYYKRRFLTQLHDGVSILFTAKTYHTGGGFTVRYQCGPAVPAEYYYDTGDTSGWVDYPLGDGELAGAEEKSFRIECAEYVNVRWETFSVQSGAVLLVETGSGLAFKLTGEYIPRERSLKGNVIMRLVQSSWWSGHGIDFKWTCGPKEDITDDASTCYGLWSEVSNPSGVVTYPLEGTVMPYHNDLKCWSFGVCKSHVVLTGAEPSDIAKGQELIGRVFRPGKVINSQMLWGPGPVELSYECDGVCTGVVFDTVYHNESGVLDERLLAGDESEPIARRCVRVECPGGTVGLWWEPRALRVGEGVLVGGTFHDTTSAVPVDLPEAVNVGVVLDTQDVDTAFTLAERLFGAGGLRLRWWCKQPLLSVNTPVPPMRWCRRDTHCQSADKAARCVNGSCVCSDGFQQPSSKVHMCVPDTGNFLNERSRVIVKGVFREANCGRFLRSTTMQETFEGICERRLGIAMDVVYECGSVHYAAAGDLPNTELGSLEEAVKRMSGDVEAEVGLADLGAMEVSEIGFAAQEECRVAGAVSAVQLGEVCVALECESDYELEAGRCEMNATEPVGDGDDDMKTVVLAATLPAAVAFCLVVGVVAYFLCTDDNPEEASDESIRRRPDYIDEK